MGLISALTGETKKSYIAGIIFSLKEQINRCITAADYVARIFMHKYFPNRLEFSD